MGRRGVGSGRVGRGGAGRVGWVGAGRALPGKALVGQSLLGFPVVGKVLLDFFIIGNALLGFFMVGRGGGPASLVRYSDPENRGRPDPRAPIHPARPAPPPYHEQI